MSAVRICAARNYSKRSPVPHEIYPSSNLPGLRSTGMPRRANVTVHLGTKFTITFSPVSVYQCLRFVRLGFRSILVLFEKAQTGEDEVLVNAYGQIEQIQGTGERLLITLSTFRQVP